MNGKAEEVETVIVGGGHAGLTMSYFLSQTGRQHVILERARMGERCRSERWDSFCFQFPNWTIELPGYKYQCDDPEAFAPGCEIVRFIEEYAAFVKAPMRCGVEVISLEQEADPGHYLLKTNKDAIKASNVVIATGPYQLPVIPVASAGVPKNIFQVHSNAYRNSTQLPPGAVLVVGSGASGCQIADDLNHSGRHVYLSVGRHPVSPEDTGARISLTGEPHWAGPSRSSIPCRCISGKEPNSYSQGPMAATTSTYVLWLHAE